MKIISVLLLAVCLCVHGASVDVKDEMVPMGERLRSLLDVKHFHLHSARENDVEVLSADAAAERNVIVDAILVIIENIRNTIINGSENLPPFDPLRIPHIGPMEVSGTGVSISAELHNVAVEGLKWFVADSVTFNSLRLLMGLHLTLPRMTIAGDYEGEARLLLIRHRAGGEFRIFVNRVEIDLEMRIGTSLLGGNLFLRELDLDFDIHDTNVFFEGLIGNGWVNSIFNSIIQNISQDVIQNGLDTINNILNEVLFQVIDNFLRDFTLDDITG